LLWIRCKHRCWHALIQQPQLEPHCSAGDTPISNEQSPRQSEKVHEMKHSSMIYYIFIIIITIIIILSSLYNCKDLRITKLLHLNNRPFFFGGGDREKDLTPGDLIMNHEV
jgi:hypothetical protein